MSKQAKSSTRKLFSILGIVVVVVIAVVVLAVVLMGGDDPKTTLSPQDYQAMFADSSHVLLDVRTVEEFNSGHIANSTNISVETLAGRLSEVPTDQPIVVYCRSGNRSAQAVEILKNAGYTQVYDLGGILAWQAAGFAIQQ